VTELKEREPAYQALARRVAARQAKDTSASAAKASAPAWGGGKQPAEEGVPAAMVEDADPSAATMPAPPAPAPRPGSRPGGQQRKGGKGGRPGGRSNKRKRR
jgi:hypothetical protein